MSSFTIDSADAPMFVITYPSVGTVEVIVDIFAAFRCIATDNPKVGWVVDMRAFNPLTASPVVRKAFADEYDRSRTIIERSTVCEARVISSPMVRGVVTAVDWLTNRKYPMKTFAEVGSAKVWVRERLRSAP